MARRLRQRRGPERLSFGSLASGSEATRFQKACNEGLEVVGARIANSRLPGLDGASTCVRACGDLALGQRGPPAKAKDQPVKRLSRGVHRRNGQ